MIAKGGEPRQAHQPAGRVGEQMREAFRTYKEEVAAGTFPAAEHTFKMDETVLNKLY